MKTKVILSHLLKKVHIKNKINNKIIPADNKHKGVRGIKSKFFTALFAVVVAITLVYITAPEEKAVVSTENVTQSAGKVSYILKDYNGKLAIFYEDTQIPYKIFDIFISNLPKKDREAIKSGIKASGDEELEKLISDYTS